MLNLQKLAAIDIAFLGARLIIAEYAIGVLAAPALGVFTLLRESSYWQIVVGVYLILLGVNYIPMLAYAVAIGNGQSAQAELSDELSDKRQAMAKYRRQSVLLVVPLLVPIIALRQGCRGARR